MIHTDIHTCTDKNMHTYYIIHIHTVHLYFAFIHTYIYMHAYINIHAYIYMNTDILYIYVLYIYYIHTYSVGGIVFFTADEGGAMLAVCPFFVVQESY